MTKPNLKTFREIRNEKVVKFVGGKLKKKKKSFWIWKNNPFHLIE